MNKLLLIRLIQFRRILAELPYYQLLLLLLVFTGSLYALFITEKSFQTILLFAGVTLAFVAYIQLNRSDKEFLQIVYGHTFPVLFTEYIILTAPVFAGILLSKYWYLAVPFTLLLSLICKLKFRLKQNTSLWPFHKLILQQNYEWASGIRRVKWLVLVAWVLAFSLSYLPFVSIFILWFLSVIFFSFYQQGEPESFIRLAEISSKKYLFSKIKTAVKQYLLLICPVLLLYLIFHPVQFYIPLLFMLFAVLVLISAIVSKYSFYVPHAKINANTTLNTFSFLSPLLPFLLPMPLLIIIVYYPKAISKLNFYLDDFNN